MAREKVQKITFFSKTATQCPVCDTTFYKEELFTGGGRLIASELTDELRRLYEPSKKFGEVYPLVYTVVVCPSCYYAAYPSDFPEVDNHSTDTLRGRSQKRMQTLSLVFDDLDFSQPRRVRSGLKRWGQN